MSRNSLSLYKRIQRLKGGDLTRLICEATLDAVRGYPRYKRRSKSDELPNPFTEILRLESYYPSVSNTHRDHAEIFLSQLQDRRKKIPRGWPSLKADHESYCSLKNYIIKRTDWPLVQEFPEWLFRMPDIEQIMWFFFHFNQQCIDDAIDAACRLVYHGIPLYNRRSESEYSPIPFTADDYVYISKKAQYDETCASAKEGAGGRLPEWSEHYFIYSEHYIALRSFFGGGTSVNPAAVEPLRSAYRRQIGFDFIDQSPERLPVSRERPLVGLVQKVLDRACPGLFDENVDSWPKQESISSWLQANKGLSKRKADAIAIIVTK